MRHDKACDRVKLVGPFKNPVRILDFEMAHSNCDLIPTGWGANGSFEESGPTRMSFPLDWRDDMQFFIFNRKFQI